MSTGRSGRNPKGDRGALPLPDAFFIPSSSCSPRDTPQGCLNTSEVSAQKPLSWQGVWRVLGKAGWRQRGTGARARPARQAEPRLRELCGPCALGSVKEGEAPRAMWAEGYDESGLAHVWGLEGSERQSLKHREGGHVRACGETQTTAGRPQITSGSGARSGAVRRARGGGGGGP